MPRFARLASCVLAFWLACLSGASAAAGNADDPVARAGQKIQALRRQTEGHKLKNVVQIHNGCQATVSAATNPETGQLLVVRQIRDTSLAVRLHNAIYRLAHDLGAAHLVLPSAEVSLAPTQRQIETERKVMVTEHAGRSFEAANQAPAKWLERVSESDRLDTALLDFLAMHEDRLPKNFLVSKTGDLRLIDHDFTLGHENPWAKNPSRFFPGQNLAYQSDQKNFEKLPEAAKKLVRRLMRAPLSELAQRYHIRSEEAQVLKTRAARVIELGLSGAILRPFPETRMRKFGAGEAPMRTHDDRNYRIQGGTITAIPGVSRTGHMLFGPYLTFPQGKHRVSYRLRVPERLLNMDGVIATLDVHDAAANQIIATRQLNAADVTGKWSRLAVPFSVTNPGNRLEFRIHWPGVVELQAGAVEFQ